MKTDIPGHYLRANHDRSIPRRVLALDTETTGEETPQGTRHTFRLGWTCRALVSIRGRVQEEEWRSWRSSFELLDYLEKSAPRDGTLWIFANNVYFDLQAMGFFRDFTARGWKLEFVYDSQLTYMLIIKRDRYTMKILSVSNYWSASTRELGELLGEPKLEVDFETVTEEELLIYCFRDTEIALDIMARYFALVRELDLGSFRLSRAAQSYGAFRHRFMKRRIFCPSSKEVRELEELAYMGGRVEAYRIGELDGGPWRCYDVNSMYPFIMSRYRLPCKAVDYFTDLSPTDAADILLKHGAVAEVELDTEEPLYAWKYKDKVIFPVGRFTAYVCTEGLRQALMRGHALKVNRLVAYEEAVLFREYIDTFYALRLRSRESGDAVGDRLCKLLMNSLYGKLAQRRPIVVKDEPCSADDYWRREVFDMVTHAMMITTRLFHREIVTAGDELVPGAIVSIPAHITEYGRMLLYSIQENIGRENVVYSDTDSLIVPAIASGKLSYPVEEGKLGALSMKWETSKLAIYGAKDYETDTSVVLKGIPPGAELVGPRTWSYTLWPGQRSHLCDGIDDYYMQREVVKRADRPYDKGEIRDDGTTAPWRLPDALSSPAIVQLLL